MFISELKEGKVEFSGHVEEVRNIGKLAFMLVFDKTETIQCILKKEELENFRELSEVPNGSYVEIEGELKKSKVAKTGKEVVVRKIAVLSESEPYPIEITGKVDTNLDKRIDWRFLDMRNKKSRDIFIFQSYIIRFLTEFLEKNKFTRLFFSKLTRAATEGGTEYFKIDYFKKSAFLAQSPQLYKEAALLSGLGRVYDIGFVYRAEPHHTTRHLCEYASFDLEMIAKDLDEILDFEEKLMKYLFEELQKNPETKGILEEFGIKPLEISGIPRISLEEANEILRKNKIKTEEGDLSPEGERFICEYFAKKNNHSFVFIRDYPFSKKPFYIMKNGKLSQGFDLLFNGVEITSGGIREHRYRERVENLKEKGLNPEKYDHLRFWKLGMPPHGGFAIGIERLTQLILGLENIREATLLPRDPERLNP